MAAPIVQVRRSSVAGKIPTTAQLSPGEFAVNTYDGKVYIEQDQGGVGVGTTVIVLNPWSVGLGSTAYNTYFTAGNVGVGSTNPTSRLQVTGDGNFSGVVTATTFNGQINAGVGTVTTLTSTNATLTNINSSGITTVGFITATNLNVSGVGTFQSSGLQIRNPANTFGYTIAGDAIGANYTLTLPVVTSNTGIAVTGLSQTFTGNQSFTGTLTGTATVNFSTTTSNITIGTNQTSGLLTLGGPSQTGTITLGQATVSQTLNLASGVSGVGTTKTINLGTGGGSGSNTLITIGSATAGAASTVTIPSPTNLLIGTAATTGTASQPLQVTGGAYVSTRLGIGQTNPNTALHIGPYNGDNLPHLYLASGNNLYGWRFDTQDFGGGSVPLRIFRRVNGADTESITVLNSSGFVGIGTTNPQSQLHITGQFQSTQSNSTTTGGGQIYLNGLTGNRIDFNTNGSAAPAFTTRSVGTKIVLYPGISASSGDHAFGVEGNTSWYSIPTAVSTQQHRWYAGITTIADLKGTGELVLGGVTTLTGTANQRLQVTGGAYVSGNTGIGTTNPVSTLQVKDALAFETTNTTTTTTSQVAVDTFATATFRSAKYHTQITCPGQIATLGGITTGGRGYTPGTFNITFTTSSGTGSAAQGTLTISNGTVGQIGITSGGTGYLAGDVLTAGGGSGLQVSVGSTDGTGAILTLGAITSAGIGYTGYFNPTTGTGTTSLTLLGGTGSNAVGLATIFDGVITSSSLLQQPTTGTGGTVYYSGSNYTTGSVLTINKSDVTNTITTITTDLVAGISTFTSLTAHGIGVSDVIRVPTAANGLAINTDYFVVTVPSTTTFTLGTAVGVGTTFTAGTSLSIAFFRQSAAFGGNVAYTNAITGVSTNYQVSDLLVLQNGTTTDYVEYGTIANNDILGTFATDISGANARLLFTPTYPNNTIKVARQAITV